MAVLKHLLLTILLLGSIHSYYVSSQAKIHQIHFRILVKKFFFFFSFFGLLTLIFVFDNAQALVFEVFFFGLWWEIEEGDEILGTLFYIGLKT